MANLKVQYVFPLMVAQAALAISESGEIKDMATIDAEMLSNYQKAVENYVAKNGQQLQAGLLKKLAKDNIGTKLWRKWTEIKRHVIEMSTVWSKQMQNGQFPSGKKTKDMLLIVKKEMWSRLQYKDKGKGKADSGDEDEEVAAVHPAPAAESVGVDVTEQDDSSTPDVVVLKSKAMSNDYSPPSWIVFLELGPPAGEAMSSAFANLNRSSGPPGKRSRAGSSDAGGSSVDPKEEFSLSGSLMSPMSTDDCSTMSRRQIEEQSKKETERRKREKQLKFDISIYCLLVNTHHMIIKFNDCLIIVCTMLSSGDRVNSTVMITNSFVNKSC